MRFAPEKIQSAVGKIEKQRRIAGKSFESRDEMPLSAAGVRWSPRTVSSIG
jgi:hypothetical protein